MPNLSEANDVITYKDLDSLQQIHAILYKINNGFLANVYKKKTSERTRRDTDEFREIIVNILSAHYL